MAQTSIAVVAEKPSVARDIARVLNARQQGQGYLHGNGYVVTWAIGHLVALAQPPEMRPEWKTWRRETLPMLPREWPLVIGEDTRDQYEVVRKILTSSKIESVVCATDAGREGELIFRYIYEAAGSDKPVQRLWISSLTPDAIRDGFARLKDWHEYDPLGNAARGRSRADWLVGMNLSRAYTLACREEISVGRVQTPTLAILVERELAIRNFVSEDYRNVIAEFSPREGQSYKGTWFQPGVEPLEQAMRLPPAPEEAQTIVERVRSGAAEIEKIEAQTKRMGPPLLYDLTELQRHANRLFGFSAQQTLELAQALYERHKLISYPRTDSRHLSQDVAKTLPKVVGAISASYSALLAPGTGERPLTRRFVDDTKVTDHHAIIPTGQSPASAQLSPDERKIFDLICRRLLMAWHEDHVWSVTTVITLVRSEADDRFHSSGTAVQQAGWKVLDLGVERKTRGAKREDDEGGDEGQSLPPGLERGQPQRVLDVESILKKTRPPKRLTEATLLTAMETAGKTLDDKELSDAMKESGLGTPATRAQIIEVLLKRGFIERQGKSLAATEKGIRLIDIVHPEVKSPAMTGQWEAYLKRIERGQAALDPFLQGIEQYVTDVVGKVGVKPVPPKIQFSSAAAAAAPALARPAPLPEHRTGELHEVLKKCFGFESFRPNQEQVCRALTAGRDVLLVMPTGSGKSLCYQLPGVVLGGTTLVISPLIALIEDQVAKMNALGLRADRIHSHRDRATSRETSIAYLEGRLDFLFIAPERLRVRGFPEMLAKRKPALIAIDEAHCISHWGHDFRPDYRTIGQHLPALRPAPVIALTATATRIVQADIAQQLGLGGAGRFIHGFRRDNIAIEIARVPENSRFQYAAEVLEQSEGRPAIIYVPRRRDADALAEKLSRFGALPYHAGLPGHRRAEVQRAFLEGRADVIVATIAFGMGIDKPDIRTVIHTALPGSVEAYYQEIGRAGRDGKPSRAILMYSYADRFTHDFFYEREYPHPAVLSRIFESLSNEPQSKDQVQKRCRIDGDEYDTALDKLWIHGGAVADYEENLTRGSADWRESYIAQREYKAEQFERMLNYASGSGCRMVALVRYFGDLGDSQQRCGICDFCAPQETVVQQYRGPNAGEQKHAAAILAHLSKRDGIATGRVYNDLFGAAGMQRRDFEELLSAMVRGGLLQIVEATFEKDGKEIEFRKVHLTSAGRESGCEQDLLIPIEIAASPGQRTSRKRTAKRAAAKQARSAAPANNRASEALRTWRLKEAKKSGVPAFRVLSDKTLEAIAADQPQTADELLEVPGVGPRIIEKYGAEILKILAQ